MNSGLPPRVIVKTTTWARDSHDLFDYEARHVVNKELDVQTSSKLCRVESDVQCIPEYEPVPQSAEPLMKVQICEKDGRCQVTPPDRVGSAKSRHLWLIVKELKVPGHKLVEGDMIKLGRFRLRIRQICNSGQSSVPELDNDDNAELSICLKDEGMTEERIAVTPCRICLQDGQVEEDDPLIAPCSCKGSIGWVHLNCLRRWIDGRRSKDQGTTPHSFYYAPLQCELCKKTYPIAIKVDGHKFALLRVPEVVAPFIVLENTTVSRGLHILSMSEKKSLKLGRGHESDVRISDVSISRTHATIRYSDDNFILEDHGSKFGTLVSLRKQQSLDEWKGSLALQIGRTTVQVSYEPPCTDDLSADSYIKSEHSRSSGSSAPQGSENPPGAATPGEENISLNNPMSRGGASVGCQMLNIQWPYSSIPYGAAQQPMMQQQPPPGVLPPQGVPLPQGGVLGGHPPQGMVSGHLPQGGMSGVPPPGVGGMVGVSPCAGVIYRQMPTNPPMNDDQSNDSNQDTRGSL
eukprot:GHVL01011059.1.p1 GENE.GHVL01011059.1~~GHVL01011059.1.p1  ORF type:complete len:518 (+),score=107.68 GHVL01011059.1:182-1735(+)